jgi:hypothetical protein
MTHLFALGSTVIPGSMVVFPIHCPPGFFPMTRTDDFFQKKGNGQTFWEVSPFMTYFTIRNTTSAIMMKSIRTATKSPIANFTGPTWTTAVSQSPPGTTTAIIGMMISLTNAVTSLVAAPPMMNATARPMTWYFLRNSMNSSINPFGVAICCFPGRFSKFP